MVNASPIASYTPSQAAKALRVSRNKVMTWIRSGQLAASDLADGDVPRYRITAEAIAALLEARSVKPAAKRTSCRRVTSRTTENFFQ